MDINKKIFFILMLLNGISFFIGVGYSITSLTSCQTLNASGVYVLANDIADQDGDCFIINASDVYLDCQGYIIDGDGDTVGDGIYIDSSQGSWNNITIYNCTIKEFNFGIWSPSYKPVNNTLIEQVNTSNNYGYGIFMSFNYNLTIKDTIASYNTQGVRIDKSNNTLLEKINVEDNSVAGVVITSSSYTNLTTSTIQNNGQKDVDISLSAEECSTTSFDEIQGTNSLPILFINSPVDLSNQHITELILCNAPYSNITDIVVDGNGNNGIYAYISNNIKLRNITASNVYEGIMLSYSNYSSMDYVRVTQATNGIMLDISYNANINHVVLSSITDYGIYLHSYYSTLYNITAFNNKYGIYLFGSYYNNLTLIRTDHHSTDGVHLNGAKYNNITYFSSVEDKVGMYVEYYSNSNLLSHGWIYNSSDTGLLITMSYYTNISNYTIAYALMDMYMYDASYMVVKDSKFIGSNQTAFYSDYSVNLLVYNNVFNNSDNIYIYGSNNEWNTTLAKGPNILNRPFIAGNAYFTPSGTGFSETCTDANHDGICDSSYDTGYGIDYAPLALSATYPLDPKIYVGNQLAWSYDGLYNTKQTINITNALKSYVSSQCSSFPCSVPITAEARSRGMLNVNNLYFKFLDATNQTYFVKVENILLKDADITNITIISKDMKQICSSNLTAPQKILRGMLKIFKIPCPNIPCSDLGDVLVETTCGIKAKLSEIWRENVAKVLKC